MVNLERKIQEQTGQSIRITSPVSTADLGIGPLSWFQAFVNGVNLGDTVPNATVNPSLSNPGQINGVFEFSFQPGGKQVTGQIPGLSTISGYEQWYFNGYQAYQDPQGYVNIYRQYDAGGVPSSGKGQTGTPYHWPGQTFNVPLLITEMGITRSNADPGVPTVQKGAAVDLTAQGQSFQFKQVSAMASAMEQYIAQYKSTTWNMGYSYFQFTDEPTFKQGAESTFGAMMLAATQADYSIGPGNTPGTYPNTTVLFTAPGVAETFAGGALPATPYPVPQLFPVTNQGGTTLLDALKQIFVNQGRTPGSLHEAIGRGRPDAGSQHARRQFLLHAAVGHAVPDTGGWSSDLASALLGEERGRRRGARK
jgi:hypothetical protein